jgi:hypothetical protein
VTTATDINNVNTTYSYSDPLDRMTQKVVAAGLSGFQGQTNVTYASPTDVHIYQDQANWADQALHTEMLYDGFGRETEERRYKNDGTYISTTKSYDGRGRTTSVSTADGAVAPTSYTGFYTTAADQAKHARVTQKDARSIHWGGDPLQRVITIYGGRRCSTSACRWCVLGRDLRQPL